MYLLHGPQLHILQIFIAIIIIVKHHRHRCFVVIVPAFRRFHLSRTRHHWNEHLMQTQQQHHHHQQSVLLIGMLDFHVSCYNAIGILI